MGVITQPETVFSMLGDLDRRIRDLESNSNIAMRRLAGAAGSDTVVTGDRQSVLSVSFTLIRPTTILGLAFIQSTSTQNDAGHLNAPANVFLSCNGSDSIALLATLATPGGTLYHLVEHLPPGTYTMAILGSTADAFNHLTVYAPFRLDVFGLGG